MVKKIFKGIVFVLTSIMTLSMFAGCKTEEIEEILPDYLDGYTKEFGETMFKENEDTIEDGVVRPNPEIRIFNYAPSIIEEDENTRYAYYCSNAYTAGEKDQQPIDKYGDDLVTDYIVARKGIKYNNDWYWSDKKYLFGPKEGSDYEGEYTCDPNVIKGEFRYDGETYTYLMAYLACSYRNTQYNHVCLAVSNDPMKGWKRCDKINPFVRYTTGEYTDFNGNVIPAVPKEVLSQIDNKTYKIWGYGQASMISVDKKGKVLMFYSAIKPMYNIEKDVWWHGVATSVGRWDFSDLNNIKMDFQQDYMAVRGIQNPASGKPGAQVQSITNADYAYDPKTRRIYGLFEMSSYAGLGYLTNYSNSQQAEIGDVFRDRLSNYGGDNPATPNNVQWKMAAYVRATPTKYLESNHNVCIIRDAYGYLPDSNIIETATSCGFKTDSSFEQAYPEVQGHGRPDVWNIWSFRIHRQTTDLSKVEF